MIVIWKKYLTTQLHQSTYLQFLPKKQKKKKNKKATIAARKRQIALYNMRLFFWEQVREIKTSG